MVPKKIVAYLSGGKIPTPEGVPGTGLYPVVRDWVGVETGRADMESSEPSLTARLRLANARKTRHKKARTATVPTAMEVMVAIPMAPALLDPESRTERA